MNSLTAKYNIIKTLIFTLIFLLNQTLANSLEIFNVAPNFIFSVILCASLVENDMSNIYYSLAFGLLFDFFNGKIMGVHTVLFVLIPFVLSEFYHTYFENMVSVKTLFAFVGCLMYSLLFAIFFGLRGEGFFELFVNVSIVEFLYNGVITIVAIFIYRKIISIRRSAWRVR